MRFEGMNGGMGEREKSLLGVLRRESLRRYLRRVRLYGREPRGFGV